MSLSKRSIAIIISIALAIGLICALLLISPSGGGNIWNTIGRGHYDASDSTDYGEYLDVDIDISGETSGAWTGSYTQTATEQVYTVDSTYYSQQQITIKLTITITYSKVSGVTIVSAYIKAVDTADSSSFNPISVSNFDWEANGLTSGSSKTWQYGAEAISTFLSNCEASSSDATISFYVYVKVQGTGTVSGNTLTAEVAETQFQSNHFVLETQQTTAEAEPSVTFSSWVASWAAIGQGLICLVIGTIIGYVVAKLGIIEVRRPRRFRR